MIRILGIDPGSLITGYGIIDVQARRLAYVDSGCIRLGKHSLDRKLKEIHDAVSEIIEQHSPDEFAIERVFMHRNAASALKLGHARGAAILAAALNDLSTHEYSPAEIKQAVSGKGNADKSQIQYMIQALLRLPSNPQADAADALAVAVCHSHHRVLPTNPVTAQLRPAR